MSKQSSANKRTSGKEQYYTDSSVVDICMQEVMNHINITDMNLLEPAGGTGEFIEGFRRFGIADSCILSYDIEPKHSMVQKASFFDVEITKGTRPLICITNPPFGRANSLSKKFFNHAAKSCDYICFLVPKSWRKWSVINSLDDNFHLVGDIEMPANCFYMSDGSRKEKDVLKTVFQVWEKRSIKRKKIIVPDHGLIRKVKGLKSGDQVADADFSMVVFGYSAGRVTRLDGPTAYKTTTYYFTTDKPETIDALEEIDFSPFYNNVAYVEALSFQEINYGLNSHFELDNFEFE